MTSLRTSDFVLLFLRLCIAFEFAFASAAFLRTGPEAIIFGDGFVHLFDVGCYLEATCAKT